MTPPVRAPSTLMEMRSDFSRQGHCSRHDTKAIAIDGSQRERDNATIHLLAAPLPVPSHEGVRRLQRLGAIRHALRASARARERPGPRAADRARVVRGKRRRRGAPSSSTQQMKGAGVALAGSSVCTRVERRAARFHNTG
eukprot:742152-Pleurochrysis_carterae.AAC.2